MTALDRAAEVVEDAFLATRQGKKRNDWVTGEEVAADLDDAGLLVTDELAALRDAAIDGDPDTVLNAADAYRTTRNPT